MAQYEAFEIETINVYFHPKHLFFFLDIRGKPESITGVDDEFSQIENMGLDIEEDGTVGFYYPSYNAPGSSVVLKSQKMPVEREYNLKSTIYESADGSIYAYNLREDQKIIKIKFPLLDKEKLARLRTFFISVVKGVKESFDLRVENGNVYRCRFIRDSLQYRQIAWNKWEVEVILKRED
jgi:hypothetical protein